VDSSLLQLAQLLDDELKSLIEKTWASDQDVIYLDNMEEAIYLISARVMDIGEIAFDAIEKGEQSISFYRICHNWAADSVSFLVLWRNIVFEVQKALLLVSEGQVQMDKYKTLKAESKIILEEASQDYYKKLTFHLSQPKGSVAQILKLSLQKNPWPTYKQQIAQIAPQCEVLVGQFKTMWNTSGLFVLVKSNFQDDFATQKTSVDEFKKGIKQIAASLEFSEEVEMKEIVKELSILNDKYLSDRTYQEMQKDLDADLKSLPHKERIIIQPNGHNLSFEDINLKERTISWLDSEILPLLNNFYIIRSNIKNQFNLSLSNIKNRIKAKDDQGVAFDKKDLLNAINTFVKRVAKSELDIDSIQEEVDQQLQKFALHKIYKGNFLNLSIASTINQYNQNSKQRFNGIKEWIEDKGLFIKQFQTSIQEEERLSTSEKLVRAINARKPHSAKVFSRKKSKPSRWKKNPT